MIGLVVLAGLLTVATPVSPPTPSPEQISEARAEGDALLAKAHAEALFVNETGTGSLHSVAAILLRHRASGFRCIFNPGKPENRVDVFRSLTLGDDVGCTTRTFSDQRTLYIFRAGGADADLLQQAEMEVKAAYPSAHLYTPPPGRPMMIPPPGASLPDHVSASLMSDDGSDRIVLGKLGEWAVEYRFSGSPAVANLGPALDGFWTTTVLEGFRHGPVAADASPSSAPVRMAPKAEADALIADAKAGDLFENVTSGKALEIRHRASGFTCGFDPGEPNRIQVFERSPRGDDIGCTTREGDAEVSYYVTRARGPLTLPQALQIEVTAIRIAHPDAVPFTGTGLMASVQPKPGAPVPVAHATARFAYSDHSQPAYSRVSVAVIRGWIVEQRVTTPADKQMEADLLGEFGMIAVTNKMSREQAT